MHVTTNNSSWVSGWLSKPIAYQTKMLLATFVCRRKNKLWMWKKEEVEGRKRVHLRRSIHAHKTKNWVNKFQALMVLMAFFSCHIHNELTIHHQRAVLLLKDSTRVAITSHGSSIFAINSSFFLFLIFTENFFSPFFYYFDVGNKRESLRYNNHIWRIWYDTRLWNSFFPSF